MPWNYKFISASFSFRYKSSLKVPIQSPMCLDPKNEGIWYGWIWHYQITFQNTIVMCKDLYVIVWGKSHFSRICILDNRLYQIALILPLCIGNVLCYFDKSVTNDIIDVEAQCIFQSFSQQVMFRLTSFGRDSWILQKDSEVTLPRSCSPGTGLQVIYIPCEHILLNQCIRFHSSNLCLW